MKFDRPIDFSYNADLNSLARAINQIIDYIEAENAVEKAPKATRKGKVAKKAKDASE